MLNKKIINFLQEIGTIMYVGGILSHIIISAVIGHDDIQSAYYISMYKESSAYILILPGLALKLLSDYFLFKSFEKIPTWFKIKTICITFLTINAFVFLVPMMSQLLELAKQSLELNQISEDFLILANKEKLVGMSNAIPLLLEIILGSFKPKIFGR